jgi:hypothetical protein
LLNAACQFLNKRKVNSIALIKGGEYDYHSAEIWSKPLLENQCFVKDNYDYI